MPESVFTHTIPGADGAGLAGVVEDFFEAAIGAAALAALELAGLSAAFALDDDRARLPRLAEVAAAPVEADAAVSVAAVDFLRELLEFADFEVAVLAEALAAADVSADDFFALLFFVFDFAVLLELVLWPCAKAAGADKSASMNAADTIHTKPFLFGLCMCSSSCDSLCEN